MATFNVYRRKFITQLFWLDAPDLDEAYTIARDGVRLYLEADYQHTFTEPCPDDLLVKVEPLNRGPRPEAHV
jgi:hypothetical protein